jgi:hypothetical protein
MNIEEEIKNIKERNDRVEIDKAWEVSFVRKISIIIITYLIAVSFLFFIGNSNPLINAIIPVIGYILSVQSLPIIKNIWVKNYKRDN